MSDTLPNKLTSGEPLRSKAYQLLESETKWGQKIIKDIIKWKNVKKGVGTKRLGPLLR